MADIPCDPSPNKICSFPIARIRQGPSYRTSLSQKGKYSMLVRLIAATIFAFGFTLTASAQDGVALKRTTISGWNVAKIQTPRDGLSCQAFKCNTAKCDVDTADAVVRLWGSAKRRAVTPMIGTQLTAPGAASASISINGISFPLSQAKNSRGKLFIAKKASDDAKIIALAAANPRGTITFKSDQAIAKFRLNGVARVLSFFEKECAIPRP